MFNKKVVGIPVNMLAWALLAVSVGYTWYWFTEIQKIDTALKNTDAKTLADQAESLSLAIAIMTTLALVGLSATMGGYTFAKKDLGVNSAAMFTLEWILIAVSVGLIWPVNNPSEVEDSVKLVPAITTTLALVLYTGYFAFEGHLMLKKNKSKK